MGLKARSSFVARAHVMAEVWRVAGYDEWNFLYQGFQVFAELDIMRGGGRTAQGGGPAG